MSQPPALPLHGGCLCGAVRYSIDELASKACTCHCRMCQRQSGAPLMGFLTARREAVRLTGDIRHYRSSDFATRAFCPTCGSALTMEYDHQPELIGLTLGSLDEPDAVPPAYHFGVESQVAWLKLTDDLPRRATGDDAEFQAAIRKAQEGG